MIRNEKNKKRISDIWICMILVATELLLSGGLFDKAYVEINPNDTTKRVYQSIDVSTMMDAFIKDEKKARSEYDDKFYLVYGRVISKKKNNKEIELLNPYDNSKLEITCKTTEKNIVKKIEAINENDCVKVYGEVSVGLLNTININIDGIDKVSSDTISDKYFTVLDGTPINRNQMKKVELNNGEISFYIPPKWSSVQHNIMKEEIGIIQGFQYRLNEIDKEDAYSESMFICYFDKEEMVDINDRKQNRLIEEAIVKDILKRDSLKDFPLTTVNTYYGPQYIYYRDNYKKSADKYQTEFIFQEVGDDGIIVYLYVYHGKPKHIDDIMITLRCMEINDKKQ